MRNEVAETRVSDVPSQEAELQRIWRLTTLLDHHDGDDDDPISSSRNDVTQASRRFRKLGQHLFYERRSAGLGAPAAVFALRPDGRDARRASR